MYRDQLSFSLIVLKVLVDWKQLSLGLHLDIYDTNSIIIHSYLACGFHCEKICETNVKFPAICTFMSLLPTAIEGNI